MADVEQPVLAQPVEQPALQVPHAPVSISAQMHPNYLKTLSQNHASWIFGGIAELIDNARDASATRYDLERPSQSLLPDGLIIHLD